MLRITRKVIDLFPPRQHPPPTTLSVTIEPDLKTSSTIEIALNATRVMVAIRGKKAKASAKPKAAAKAKVAANKEAEAEAVARLKPQQKLTQRREEEFLAFVRFALQSNLAGGNTLTGGSTVVNACNTLLTSLCAYGKEKTLSPTQILAKLPRTERKRVCGAIFSADEIAYSCRNCQLDTTCVMCKDCFTHSDHAGHDVYFQRTTAGSSCDCGDVHAWKQSGFCSRHKGAEASETGTKKHKLPKHIGQMAPVVIDAVVEHIYQVLLGTQYGFELAEAFELFTRDIPPNLLPIQSDTDVVDASDSRRNTGSRRGSSTAVSTRSTRLSSHITAEPGARSIGPGGRLEAQASETKHETTDLDADNDRGVLFGVRLHNDDVHSLNEVINHLYVELAMSKPQARTSVKLVDKQGDATVAIKPLLQCPAIVGNLVRRSLNISVAPTWWEKQMEIVPGLLEWLQFISTTSDGLSEIVSEALQKQRSPVMKGFLPVSGSLPKGKTVHEFVKERSIRLHANTLDMLILLIGGEKNTDIFTWACERETAQLQRFNFRAEDDTTTVATAGFLAEGNRVHCKNIFVEEFVKVVSLSPSYRCHESIRKSFDAVVAKYFTSEQITDAASSLTTSSTLALLMRYDCTLRKDAVERSHSFLREHLVDIQFRASMLEAYLQSYASMTSMFLRGLGNSSESIFDFAVQFLTVPHLVQNYTKKEVSAHPGRLELVRELLIALNTVFQSAVDKKGGMINADHPALSSQKYKHCVENLEYIFNIGTLSSELVCNEDNLKTWLSCLSILQGGDPQVRRGIHQNHVEYESDSWLSMFNLGIRVHSVFAISWNGFNPSLFETPEVKVANIFAPIIEATLASSIRLNEKVTKKTLTSVAKLAMGTRDIGSQDRSIKSYDFNVTSQPTSLHIPLHRFLTAAVRHICISQAGLGGSIPSDGLLRTFGFDKLSVDKQWELVEMPLRCLVMASQIHSNLWRRNGDENMLAQLYNYSALPYCIHYRDADTLMLQLSVLMTGPDALVARMVDRFQLGSYFNDHGNMSTPQDLVKQFGYSELEQGIDEQQHLQMLEEFLRLVIVIGTSLPSATGTAYDNDFLAEEMLQQLCSKSQCFSKLFDLAILPSGQDDIPTARLEGVLEKVSNFMPPSGLEPGRYELKDGLLENYNPYFPHLNREAHELARDRWTTYRNTSRQQAKRSKPEIPPSEPLKPAKTPVDFLRPVQAILTCESTVAIAQVILWKVISPPHSGTASDLENSVSDAVISTCLHLLVHGVHTASQDSDCRFWTRLSKANAATSNMSVLHILSQLLEQATTLLDSEQTGTVEWLIWKITAESPVCRKVFEQLANSSKAQEKKAAASPSAPSDSGQSGNSPPITLEQRKMEARKRAMEAMAKRQAAFQAMIDVADDEEEKKEENETGHDAHSVLGKRTASLSEEQEVTRKKRREVENEQCYNCILCHDSSDQGQMGMAAYVHQSTVLAPGFRPEPKEALRSEGKKIRGHVKKIIEKMELCSGGSSTSSDMIGPPSPTLRAFSTSFPEWYMDGSLEDQLTRDNTAQNSPRPPAARRPRNDRIRFGNGNLPMLEGEMLQTDDELEVLEGVFDLQEDQQLFPMDMRGAVSLDLRGDRVEPRRLGGREFGGARGGNARAQGEPMYDDSDDEDASPRFRLERMPPGFGRQHESAKLYLTPCGLHVRTCQHAVHINCLERYISSLHDKAMRGEEFDGVQAIDPDSAMTQFLCPLCKTLSNFLIPTSEPRKSIAKNGEQKQTPSVVISSGDEEEKSSTWDKIVEEQLSMPGWYRSVLGRDGGFEDDEKDTEHDMWRDYFEDTLWEPHGSLEKGAPFLWSACAYTLASFLTVADDELRDSGNTTLFDPLTDPCPPSLEKELESLTSVTKFSRWTFSLLEHCADAKVIWETAKRCCPINSETKREYRKFTKVLGSIDACLRGTILGLLLADTFTAFVVASVIADELETIWRFIPVFTAADMLQRLHAEFFEPTKMEGTSLFQDKFSAVETGESLGTEQKAAEEASALALAPRRTRSGRAISPSASSKSFASVTGSDQQLMEALEASGENDSEAYAALQLLQRMAKAYPTEKRKVLTTVSDVKARLQRVLPPNAEFVRRMKLFWRCLVEKEANAPANTRTMQIPTLLDIAHSSDATFDQIWRWCMDRMLSKTYLGSSKVGDKCEHTEGCSEAYVASMFILRDVPTRPRLIDLPIQYDELYSEMAGRKCTRCEKSPCDPGLCLICGEFLCCGDSCCTRAFMPHGPPVGECTRHAAECGGGVGIVLILEQCRIAVVGGSMAAYFPSPYVDSHGEEDVGLQRGRPLRLDMARYRHLQSLWLNHRIFTEVSRQRNQRDPQYTINLSYM
ncbi:E3 ubiquitin-protein ligase UBR2 [Phytophthora citrophthora]|uniref:E3 ubiquitin-protein ligase n=1 Tax=Phytophthora citrophthora TaxID=4793 RepID=A0AAD9H106_9STRA|nr:E3 ubiquitin-protein ligase UBR2 [Phytophthora citrophthora]